MENKTVVGRYSSGEIAWISQTENPQKLKNFVDSLDLDKQIDLLCIVETILLDESRSRSDKYHKSVGVAYLVLLDFSDAVEFKNEMIRLGIVTSIDRVRRGRKLRL